MPDKDLATDTGMINLHSVKLKQKWQGFSPCILKKIVVARQGFGYGYTDD
ncbi:MAG: hypothetical protein F6K39_45675 [Okeania sp. SIO3B3]|nr:hypothetical protein [Okeania sp. SIO3B3]